MRIGVMGAGSIGCVVGGRLTVVASVERQLGNFEEAEALADCGVVLVCVKSAHTEAAAEAMLPVLSDDCVVVSMQNGLANPPILKRILGPRPIVPCIVGFNVVSRERALFHRAFSGTLMFERSAAASDIIAACSRAQLDVEVRDELLPDQCTKLVVNLNNAVSALSGAPSRQLLHDPGYRRIVGAVIGEALDVLAAAGIKPAPLRGVPLGVMRTVLKLPTPLVRLVTRAQMRVDPEPRSSMWEDLDKGRPTEIDYLNGEIVKLADEIGAPAPVNRRIVALVREAEKTSPGSPNIPADELWQRLHDPG